MYTHAHIYIYIYTYIYIYRERERERDVNYYSVWPLWSGAQRANCLFLRQAS